MAGIVYVAGVAGVVYAAGVAEVEYVAGVVYAAVPEFEAHAYSTHREHNREQLPIVKT